MKNSLELKSYKYSILWSLWLMMVTFPSLKTPSKETVSSFIPHLDKIAHFTFYFVFTLLLVLALKRELLFFNKTLSIYTFAGIVAFVWGLSMEILQKTITDTRSADIFDVLFNTFGIVVALVFITRLTSKCKKVF
ncbi:VanZ family protein [Capnocytophaga canimorsus]|nr:VanZ family protein [Capnocytophaga canimorsus]AYW37583.1 VanZ family protein [Capnocytophaga canimorsus]MDT9498982.1 VanZ family protein [Capnocytophaga canimorsus]